MPAGEAEEPEAEAPGEAALEVRRVAAGLGEALRDEDGVLGVVADHAATEDEPLAPWSGPAACDARCGQTFRWKAEAISNGGAEEDAFEEDFIDVSGVRNKGRV